MDIACGVGYGTPILLAPDYGGSIEQLVGVDIDKEAIEYAKEHYPHKKAGYLAVDALSHNIDKKLQAGVIPSFKVGRHWRVKREDLSEFIENQKRGECI